MGKAIAAYERLLLPGRSRFDQYVEAILNDSPKTAKVILNPDEIAGLKLFIGDAHCTNCHKGPLFTNNDFPNTGVPLKQELPEDTGRSKGAEQVMADEFNCLSLYSDTTHDQCAELNFLVVENAKLLRQFKPPSLAMSLNAGLIWKQASLLP
jgi:cytochrome c peroxidase